MTFNDDHPAITRFLRRLDVVLEPLDERERVSVLAASEARVRDGLGTNPTDDEVDAAIGVLGPVEDIADPIIARAGVGPSWEIPFTEREEDIRRDRFRGILAGGASVFALVGVLLEPYAALLLAIVAVIISLTWLRSAGTQRSLLQIAVGLAVLALVASGSYLGSGLGGA